MATILRTKERHKFDYWARWIIISLFTNNFGLEFMLVVLPLQLAPSANHLEFVLNVAATYFIAVIDTDVDKKFMDGGEEFLEGTERLDPLRSVGEEFDHVCRKSRNRHQRSRKTKPVDTVLETLSL